MTTCTETRQGLRPLGRGGLAVEEFEPGSPDPYTTRLET
jgi:hypothetical protein